MSQFATRSRKALAVLVSATLLAGSLAASSGADAKPIWFPKPLPAKPMPLPMPFKPGPKFGGYGYGAAALAGSLALGVIAAGAAAAADEDCYITRRSMVDEDGNEYIRRVRVCD